MQISRGKYKNRKIETIKSLQTRPTASKTKEAIFNMIAFEVENAQVLDLFAGSGLLGIESLSMYAKNVDFNDVNKEAIKNIEHNLKKLEITNYTLSTLDAFMFLDLNKNKQYDIIFLDPPYDFNIINDLLIKIINLNIIKESGIIICESSLNEQIINEYNNFIKYKEKKYGKNKISIFRSR